MTYHVILSLNAIEDILRITMFDQSKAVVFEASAQLQSSLAINPKQAGRHLSEGLFYIDREPLRAFFEIDDDNATVEIVRVRRSIV